MAEDKEPIKPIDLGNLKDVNEELGYIENALLGIASNLSETIKNTIIDIKDESKGIGQILASEVTKNIKGIARGLGDTLNIQEKIYSGQVSSKDISKKLENLEEKRASIGRQLEILGKEDILTKDQQGEQQKELNVAIEAQEVLLKAAKEEAEALEKGLGLAGKVLKSIKKVPFLRDFINTEKLATALRKKLKDSNKEFLNMGDILPEVKKAFKEGLSDPTALLAFGIMQGTKALSGFGKSIKGLVSMLDEYNGKLTKNFAISQKEAVSLNKKFRDIKNSAGGGLITVSGIGDAFVALNNKAGTFADISDKTLQTFDKLNKEAGISTETLIELNDLTHLNKGTLEDTTKEFTGQLALLKGQTGKALNLKRLQEDIKNVSAAVKLNFGGSATAIAEAVFKAKALGLELKDLENISSSLLNFQSSIEDELSAELLTGRQLNLEGARYAALIGDQAMLAEELANNIGTAADFTDMTVIAQDALAKSLGMNRNQLAETLIQQERLNSLNAKGNTLQEKYNTLRANGNSEQQIATMLGNKVLAQQLESAGLQEKFNLMVTNFKEQFLAVADTILPAMLKGLTFFSNHMRLLVGIAVTLKGLQLAIAAATIAASFAKNPIKGGIGLALGIAGIASLASGIAAAVMIGDGEFRADGRTKITTKEGEFYPSIKDDIVVAPGAADAMNSINRNTGGNTQAVAGGSTPQAVNNNVTVSPSDTKITLTLNGQAIGNANARQAYGVGNSIKALGGGVDYSATV